jgi:hypothetical protein
MRKFNDLETDVEAKLNYSVADPRDYDKQFVGEINLVLRMQITDPKNHR